MDKYPKINTVYKRDEKGRLIDGHWSTPEFEYLKDEIDPPTWVLILCIIFAIPGSLALAYLFDRIDLATVFSRGGGRSFRRGSGIRIRRRRF